MTKWRLVKFEINSWIVAAKYFKQLNFLNKYYLLKHIERQTAMIF